MNRSYSVYLCLLLFACINKVIVGWVQFNVIYYCTFDAAALTNALARMFYYCYYHCIAFDASQRSAGEQRPLFLIDLVSWKIGERYLIWVTARPNLWKIEWIFVKLIACSAANDEKAVTILFINYNNCVLPMNRMHADHTWLGWNACEAPIRRRLHNNAVFAVVLEAILGPCPN